MAPWVTDFWSECIVCQEAPGQKSLGKTFVGEKALNNPKTLVTCLGLNQNMGSHMPMDYGHAVSQGKEI